MIENTAGKWNPDCYILIDDDDEIAGGTRVSYWAKKPKNK